MGVGVRETRAAEVCRVSPVCAAWIDIMNAGIHHVFRVFPSHEHSLVLADGVSNSGSSSLITSGNAKLPAYGI